MVAAIGREQRLLRVATSDKARLNNFAEGVSIEAALGTTIAQAISESTAGRLRMADRLLAEGNRMIRARPRMYRAAIGRYYYAMYHAMRAVIHFIDQGDDSEGHSVLPKNIPAEFPNATSVANQLRNARLERNTADYEPFPVNEALFRSSALALHADAVHITQVARTYLRSKGCTHA